MKHLKTIAAAFLAISMAGCSQDQVGPDTPTPPEDGIYSSIKLKMPTTRSGEKNEGTETGKDYENNVGSILVILATKDSETDPSYKFLTFAINDAPLTGTANSTHKIVFQDKETLFKHAGENVYVFAYCNPNPALVKKVAGTFANGTYSGGLEAGATFTDETCPDVAGDVSSIWDRNGFLMTSVKVAQKQLGTEEQLKGCTTPDKAFDLGQVEVVRAASRFDFRDASPEGTAAYTYEVRDEDKTDKPLVANITLTRMAMVNQRNQFYYLPRTSTTEAGADSRTVTLCPGFFGMEDNHVLSPETATFTDQLPAKLTPGSDNGLIWTTMAQLAANDEDEDSGDPVEEDSNKSDSWGNSDKFKEGYHIWRYTTENTWDVIPPTNGSITSPENSTSITTGFVFEAEIKPEVPAGSDFKSGTDIMYCFNNRLFLNATALYDAVKNTPVSTLATAFNNAFTVADDGTITPKSDAEVEKEGFTIYKPAADKKYYCYYFGYNRHKDDGQIYTTGDMEFATVRNNVYKLAVTNIKQFGTFTPPTDVEEWDTYFQLEVLARPWVVRVNDFEF